MQFLIFIQINTKSDTTLGNRTEVVSTLERDNVKDSEVRASNYIVMKYLLSQGYKVSAVTFEEEVRSFSLSLL